MMPVSRPEYTVDTCLDTDAMCALLQHALPDAASGRVVIDALRVTNVRRSSSRHRNPHPLTLRYELALRDTASGVATRRDYYGKVYRNGASAEAPLGTAALRLPQLDLLLWAWPNDPGLPQLAGLLDPAQTLRWWGERAAAVCALRYEPEWRATLRYSRRARGQNSTQLFAKTFSDGRGAAIYQRFVHFWHKAQHDTREPVVAEPLGYSAETRTLWQARAGGEPLLPALTAACPSSLAERVAYAIAAIHAAPRELAGVPLRDAAYWLVEIRRRCTKITRVAPELAERVARVADALDCAARELPPHAPTLIHGDCHPEQMWIDGKRIVLFDFDEFVLGDPMEDVAEFITKLGTDAAPAALARQLARAYQDLAPQHFCHVRLQWHLAIQQLLQTSRAFVFQVNDWRSEVARRLARAEALCGPVLLEVNP